MNSKIYRFIPLLLIAAVLVLQACSAKKNTAGSRFWQAMNTRYNVYYNGKTNYDEQIREMLDNYEDDYSQRVLVHPAAARANSKAPQPAGSFDRTIEKMQKAIALHSIKKKPKKKSGKQSDPKYREWMSRDEYNPFLHNAWYLLAKSQYMKGDFLDAAATFRYIYRHFTWKPLLVEEAKAWEAMSYTALGWTSEADNVLAHLHPEKIDDKHVRGLAHLAFADYDIHEKRYAEAIPHLKEAIDAAKGSQKVRLNFLLGQIYELTGDRRLAYQAYKRAGSSSGSSYRTKFNARIKQSAVFDGANIESEVRSLRRMTHYDRNKDYLDQIYFAIGNLYLSRQDTTKAVENYVKAAEKSTRNGIDKAISQLTLGGIYFAQHKYDKAQPCYSEAIPLINEDYPNYKALKRRSDVLDELAVYAQNVTLQDSLLKLSQMSDEEVHKVIKKIIDELKKKEKEEKEAAAREEYLAKQSTTKDPTQGGANTPQAYQLNSDDSWYFYNTATKNAGKTAFQQAWGNRKLEDHWRRRNKNVFSSFDDDSREAAADSLLAARADSLSTDSVQVDKEALRRSEDPHFEEYYLKQIPRTEEQIQAAHDIIQEGLYNMGVILKDKLEDYDAAAAQFAELLQRYPDNTYRLDVYYNLYLMYMRNGDDISANIYRNLILNEFADSKYGEAMQDPDYFRHLKNMYAEQEQMYEAAYAAYLANDNEAVHAAYAEMMNKYPLSKIMPKFMFIDALSYVTQRKYDKFKEVLKDMLQRYPETDITPTASGIVKQLNAGRKLEGGGSNARGMLWSTRLSNDTTPADLERKFTPFQEDNDKPQVFILLYPRDSVSSNMLLYEVARHNFNTFVVKDYDLEQMSFGRLGLLVVKGFENFDEVKHYRTLFEEDASLELPGGIHEVLISESNFQLLLTEGRSFEDYFNYLEEKNDKEHDSQVGAEADDAPDEKPQKGKKKSEKKPDQPEKSVKPDKASKSEKPEKPAQPEQPVEPERPVPPTPDAGSVESAADLAPVPPPTAPQPAPATPLPTPSRSVKPTKAVSQPATDNDARKIRLEDLNNPNLSAKERQQLQKKYDKQVREEEKARQKAEREADKARTDSLDRAYKEREKAMRQAEKAMEDSIKRADKAREQALEIEQQQREYQARQAENERRLQYRDKEALRKAKLEERRQAQKEREEKRKAEQKRKKQEAKERQQAQKQKQKERKEAQKRKAEERKQKQKERQQQAKERAQEAKDRAKGKGSGSDKPKGSTGQTGANAAPDKPGRSVRGSTPTTTPQATPPTSDLGNNGTPAPEPDTEPEQTEKPADNLQL